MSPQPPEVPAAEARPSVGWGAADTGPRSAPSCRTPYCTVCPGLQTNGSKRPNSLASPCSSACWGRSGGCAGSLPPPHSPTGWASGLGRFLPRNAGRARPRPGSPPPSGGGASCPIPDERVSPCSAQAYLSAAPHLPAAVSTPGSPGRAGAACSRRGACTGRPPGTGRGRLTGRGTSRAGGCERRPSRARLLCRVP